MFLKTPTGSFFVLISPFPKNKLFFNTLNRYALCGSGSDKASDSLGYRISYLCLCIFKELELEMGHLDAHNMVPEIPEFWQAEVHRYLEMSREQQLTYWREKRALLKKPIEDGFDEYQVWVRYLGEAVGETDYSKLVPSEILEEEAVRSIPDHDDGEKMWSEDE